MCPTETHPLYPPFLEMHPQSMSDCELLRFAQTARQVICSSTQFGEEPPPEAVASLTEARREWKKRFPALPLSESL